MKSYHVNFDIDENIEADDKESAIVKVFQKILNNKQYSTNDIVAYIKQNAEVRLADKDKPVLKLRRKECRDELFNCVPDDCIIISKQYKGDWVGSYESDVWLICQNKDGKVVKIIPEEELDFKLNWSGTPLDEKYKIRPTLIRGK